MNSFKVSYVTTLPKEGNAPRVTIKGNEDKEYTVAFIDTQTQHLISSGTCRNNQVIMANANQWYTSWGVFIFDENGSLVFKDLFSLKGKNVFIKMDAYALGDNIAWIPYVQAFKDKHECNVICSTFFNDLFVENYPDIMFVKPNTIIENIYAQYYIGASNDENPHYSPVKSNETALQHVASSILGLEHTEIRPDLTKMFPEDVRVDKKYVTIAEFGSANTKEWKCIDGWKKVVDFIKSKGYEVIVISKEPTNLTDVIDHTGNIPLTNRAFEIMNAKMHLGVSSGLSWLAWAVGTPVVMISDVTPTWHEFHTNITRFCANKLNGVDYEAVEVTDVETVLKKLGELLV